MNNRDARDFVWQNRFLFAELADLRTAAAAVDGAIRRAKLSSNPLYIDLEDEEEDEEEAASSVDGAAELRRQLDRASEAREGPGGFISRDGHMQLLVVRTTFSNSSLSLADRLVADLEPILAGVQRDAGPGVTVSAQGDVYTALAEHRALSRGVLSATLLTVVVVALGLFLYYRSVLGLVALFFSLAVGTVLTFALTRLTIGHLNLATAFLSSIVVGNGINAGLILLARFEEERRGGRRGADAIEAAVSGTFASTLAAALTASVAYASLTVTSFEGFQHFGVIGGMGMIVCWAAAYMVLPAALAVLERRGALTTAREPALGRLAGRLLPRNPALVAGVGLVLTGAGLHRRLRLPDRRSAREVDEEHAVRHRRAGPDARAAAARARGAVVGHRAHLRPGRAGPRDRAQGGRGAARGRPRCATGAAPAAQGGEPR